MTRRMLLMFPSFLVFNGLFSMFMRIYQCQGKVRFVNVLSLSENLLIAALAAVGIPFLGSDAAWLAFPAAELACIAVIGWSVFRRSGKVTFALEDWLKLEDSFGAQEDERMDLSIRSMEEVVNISEAVVDFLAARGVNSRSCMAAGLAVEEMAGNTVTHGFVDGKPHSIDVRLVCREGEVRIRLRDDCTAFDPLAYAKQFRVGEDPAKNLGIRLISRMAKEMVYLNNVGMNVLLIRL
jgi:anti-sigma regulatory factor (Ser/Thr protein kinase)